MWPHWSLHLRPVLLIPTSASSLEKKYILVQILYSNYIIYRCSVFIIHTVPDLVGILTFSSTSAMQCSPLTKVGCQQPTTVPSQSHAYAVSHRHPNTCAAEMVCAGEVYGMHFLTSDNFDIWMTGVWGHHPIVRQGTSTHMGRAYARHLSGFATGNFTISSTVIVWSHYMKCSNMPPWLSHLS